ncbi:hypothetical protein MRX96_047509 [Rhipicephalus microplus]
MTDSFSGTGRTPRALKESVIALNAVATSEAVVLVNSLLKLSLATAHLDVGAARDRTFEAGRIASQYDKRARLFLRCHESALGQDAEFRLDLHDDS